MQNLLNDCLWLLLRRLLFLALFILFVSSICQIPIDFKISQGMFDSPLLLFNKHPVLHKIVCFLCNRDCFLWIWGLNLSRNSLPNLCKSEGWVLKISKYLNTKRSLISFIVQLFTIQELLNYKESVWNCLLILYLSILQPTPRPLLPKPQWCVRHNPPGAKAAALTL